MKFSGKQGRMGGRAGNRVIIILIRTVECFSLDTGRPLHGYQSATVQKIAVRLGTSLFYEAWMRQLGRRNRSSKQAMQSEIAPAFSSQEKQGRVDRVCVWGGE